jgi:uncharacterized Tic20 family protein
MHEFPSILSLPQYLAHISLFLSLSFSLSQFNSIQGPLLAWETQVYIAKASEIDNNQK